jgi:predicted nucleic acid-binding protein
MSLVLDSSVTLAWVYSDETTDAVVEVFDLLRQGAAWVPQLWRLEVANALQMGVRRKCHDEEFRDATLADLSRLPIHIDNETDEQAWGATLDLASLHNLTLYDAAYLELAVRRKLALATLDAELRKAAHLQRVKLLGK